MSASTDIPPAAPFGDLPPTPGSDAVKPSPRKAVKLILRTSLLIQIINSAAGVELARGLGLHHRGELAAAMLWPIFAGTLGTLGIEEAMTYHVARDPDRVGRLTGSGLALSAIQSALFGVVTVAVIPLVLHHQPSSVVVSAWIYSLYVPIYMFSVTLNAVLNGLHRYSWFNHVLIVVALLVIGFQTLLLAIGAMSVRSLVISFVVAYAITSAFVAWLVRRAGVRRLTVDRQTMRSLIAYGIRSHASTVPSTLNYSVDQLVISVVLTASQLGIYVVAVTTTSLTILVGASVAKAILPNVAARAPGPERTLLVRRLVNVTILMSAAATAPLLALTPQLITLLFGNAYAAASDVARVLLVAAVALSSNRALEAVLRGIGRPLDAGVAEFVALGATAVGLATLLPLFGLLGAALASLLAYVVSMGYMVRRLTRALEISPASLLTPDRETVNAMLSRLRRRSIRA